MTQFEKTAILTGSTGGIGQAIAKVLAQQGWNLGLINRSSQKTSLQLSDLRNSYPHQAFTGFIANLMDTSELERVVEEVRSKYTKISALYNVAGFLSDERTMSPQNIEGHFAINTLAPYFLTQHLRQLLSTGTTSNRPSVVVNFSSSAVKSVKQLDVATLTNPERIGGLMGAYANTKAALAASSLFIQDELLEDGILIAIVDPGPTKTAMTQSSDGMPFLLRLLRPLLFKSAKFQAQKLVDGVEVIVRAKKSGIFISEGSQDKHTDLILNKGFQAQVKFLLDQQI